MRTSAFLGAAALSLAACGGGDEAPDAADVENPAAAAGQLAEEMIDDALGGAGDVVSEVLDEGSSGSGGASVTIGAETLVYAVVEPGPDDDFYTFCTTVAGSLQAVMQEVDAAGTPLGGELSVVLFAPDSDYATTGDPQEFDVAFPDGRWLVADGAAGAIDAAANGAHASGTAELGSPIDPSAAPVIATFDVTC